MPSHISNFRIDMLTRRLNTRLRNEIIDGHIDVILLRQELTNLRIPYNQSLNRLNSYTNIPRNNDVWNVFFNLTQEQFETVENLLRE